MKLVGCLGNFGTLSRVRSHIEVLRQPPINQWEVMKDRVKEKYLPSFHRTHLVNQMLDLRQSSSCVSNYINAFEKLIQCYELV